MSAKGERMENFIKAKVAALRNPRRTIGWLHGEVSKVMSEKGKKICLHNFYKAVENNYKFPSGDMAVEIAEEILIKQELEQMKKQRSKKEA